MSSGSSRADSAVEPTRSREHHGQLAALCGVSRRSRGPCFGGGIAEVRYGLEHSLPRSQRQADLFEVAFGQVGQNVRFDLIVTEDGLVLAKTEAPQPRPNVHAGSSKQAPGNNAASADASPGRRPTVVRVESAARLDLGPEFGEGAAQMVGERLGAAALEPTLERDPQCANGDHGDDT